MLTALIESTEEKVIAPYTSKDLKPFICQVCRERVILKKGSLVVHHFAHEAKTNCHASAGMSIKHLSTQLEIFEHLQKDSRVDKLELERVLDGCRPDISFRVDHKHYVAVEVQISNLSVDDLFRRTEQYGRKGIAVIWILPMRDGLSFPEVRVTAMEKWLTELAFGHAFYYQSAARVVPVQFKQVYSEVPLTSFGGGYRRALKDYRSPVVGISKDLVGDFFTKPRKEAFMRQFRFPNCSLWVCDS